LELGQIIHGHGPSKVIPFLLDVGLTGRLKGLNGGPRRVIKFVHTKVCEHRG